jgi:hypothetical protein
MVQKWLRAITAGVRNQKSRDKETDQKKKLQRERQNATVVIQCAQVARDGR